ncbi:MAG: hypothetical protein F2536_00560 [Actinobacteria bacterium]|uniref:Unannotated protein n=1 Tax=freshwater metagenome TaxID=449393 RepID=A0A6J6BJ40_9ZZZZ|nr:hypothetical protein [Actinomycetota bacterium]MTA89405.1 hypothetical protein [Actinomycetota bacterium]
MNNEIEEPGHGGSLAAWVTVGIIILAFSIGTFFFFLDVAIMVWLSAGLALLGVGVGYYLRKAGYGVGGQHSKH